MTLSFLAIKLQQDFDLGPAMIGFLLGAGSMLGAFVAPVVGALSDGLGRKRILTLVLLTLAMGMIALALAETVIVFCVAQVMTATAISLYGPMSRALMSDICTETVRLKVSGKQTPSGRDNDHQAMASSM
jgi:predicted MFS family arabinose efflux permease